MPLIGWAAISVARSVATRCPGTRENDSATPSCTSCHPPSDVFWPVSSGNRTEWTKPRPRGDRQLDRFLLNTWRPLCRVSPRRRFSVVQARGAAFNPVSPRRATAPRCVTSWACQVQVNRSPFHLLRERDRERHQTASTRALLGTPHRWRWHVAACLRHSVRQRSCCAPAGNRKRGRQCAGNVAVLHHADRGWPAD